MTDTITFTLCIAAYLSVGLLLASALLRQHHLIDAGKTPTLLNWWGLWAVWWPGLAAYLTFDRLKNRRT